jgi:hypothetical protein
MAGEIGSLFARIARRDLARPCLMVAAVALLPTITVFSLSAGEAAENGIVAPVRPIATPVRPVGAAVPSETERETWRRTMQRTPKPKNGCFTAAYPETEWREVPCRKPPDKLFLPKRSGTTTTQTIGGTGTDFSAQATRHITEVEGSFDSVTGVTSECDVACPKQVCPATPSCTASSANQYTLQLNTQPFTTSACSTSPAPGSCKGWQQFLYEGSGSVFIQYWLLNFGPSGTMCPTPRGAHCDAMHAFSDGWCPIPLEGNVFCVVNGQNAVDAGSQPITSLQQMTVAGAAASPGLNDSISVSTANTFHSASGNNFFPDLGSQWQIAEFNVFGDGNGDQAVFNGGSTIVVRIGVDNGTTSKPSCDSQTFTGESNNLTVVATSGTPSTSTFGSLVFTESNVPGSVQTDCSKAATIDGGGPPIVTSIGPAEGQCATASTITIRGSNLAGAARVVADSHSNLSPLSLQLQSVANDEIIATVPAFLPGGVYEIVVSTPFGESAQVWNSAHTDTFSVLPTVTGISPNRGPVAGGTQVTVNGGCFDARTRISFGGAEASGNYPCGIGLGPSSQCVVYSPPTNSASSVDVVADTNGAASVVSPVDRFTYAGPQITSISPTSGPVTGGTEVTISGTGFPRYDLHNLQNTPISFGSVGTIAECDSTWCVVVSPRATSPGPVGVTATAFGATSGSSSGDVFTYNSAPVLTRFEFTRDYVGGISAVVDLDGNAPSSGATVALNSSNPNLVGLPATATIPAGKKTTIVPVTTNPSPTDQSVTATASYDNTSLTSTVSISASPPLTLSSDVTALDAGQSANVTVGLNSPAPPAGAAVTLSSTDPAEISIVPTIATVPAGNYSTVFSVTNRHSNSRMATIQAAYDGASASLSFRIPAPPRCTAMQCARFYHWDSNLCRCEPGIPVAH